MRDVKSGGSPSPVLNDSHNYFLTGIGADSWEEIGRSQKLNALSAILVGSLLIKMHTHRRFSAKSSPE
jgi:hypothetical protein